MNRYDQIKINSLSGIESIESRIGFLESKISNFEKTETDCVCKFKDILLDKFKENGIGKNSYSFISDLYGFNSLSNNYITGYFLNNLNEISGIDNLNNVGTSDQKTSAGTVIGNIGSDFSDEIADPELYGGIVSLTEKLGEEFGVDPDLINAIIKVESNFNPYAISKSGAMGLMQLMPKTAEVLGVDNPYDIYQNLSGGIRMIKELLGSFGGDLKLALAAYNAGSRRVKECNGIPPIEETQNYVKKVLSLYKPEII